MLTPAYEPEKSRKRFQKSNANSTVPPPKLTTHHLKKCYRGLRTLTPDLRPGKRLLEFHERDQFQLFEPSVILPLFKLAQLQKVVPAMTTTTNREPVPRYCPFNYYRGYRQNLGTGWFRLSTLKFNTDFWDQIQNLALCWKDTSMLKQVWANLVSKYVYSWDLNNGLVRYSNGPNMSNRRMVCYSSHDLNTEQKVLFKPWPEYRTISAFFRS